MGKDIAYYKNQVYDKLLSDNLLSQIVFYIS